MHQRSAILIFAILGCVGIAPLVAAGQGTVDLAQSRKEPKIHLSLKLPKGWETEWYDDSSQSTARVYRSAAQGKDAIVIAASPIGQEYLNVPAEKLYPSEVFQATARLLGATMHQPGPAVKWPGLYLEYPLASSATKGRYKVTVRNWMLISGNQIVQFQCYYILSPDLSDSQQQAVEQKLDREYAEILNSVQKTD